MKGSTSHKNTASYLNFLGQEGFCLLPDFSIQWAEAFVIYVNVGFSVLAGSYVCVIRFWPQSP